MGVALRDLGHEVNLILGLREFEDVAWELVLGVFIPEDGFDESDKAYFIGSEFRYEF